MSSRREVLVRTLALLQKKTLIETKNRTLKCLKRHYSTVRSMKNVAVLTEGGALALLFRPHPGGFDSSRVPTPGNLPSKAKKMLMPGGQPGGGGGGRHSWNWLMHKGSSLHATFFASVFTSPAPYCLGARNRPFADTLASYFLLVQFKWFWVQLLK